MISSKYKARLTLLKYVTQKRLPKHKGSDAEIRTKTITAIVKLCLDPASSIPVGLFCALNLTRLQPVDTDHVDVTALLAEISALRREVRAITQLKVEVDQLKTLLCSNVSPSRQERSDASLSITKNPASKSFADLALDLKAAAATGPILTAHAQKKKIQRETCCRFINCK